jgi:rhamnose transport system ATP-binding protein
MTTIPTGSDGHDQGPTMTAATVPPSEATKSLPRVALTGISKRFGATQALSDVSISLMPGTIHALVGENGAGKSTLVKILAGMHQPDAGTISLDGDPCTIHDPAASRAMGIAVVHQEPSLFPDLSVAENVYLGDPPRGRFGGVD